MREVLSFTFESASCWEAPVALSALYTLHEQRDFSLSLSSLSLFLLHFVKYWIYNNFLIYKYKCLYSIFGHPRPFFILLIIILIVILEEAFSNRARYLYIKYNNRELMWSDWLKPMKNNRQSMSDLHVFPPETANTKPNFVLLSLLWELIFSL